MSDKHTPSEIGREALRIYRLLHDCDPAKRQDLLATECDADEELMELISRMLVSVESRQSSAVPSPTRGPGEYLGPYEIVIPLGSGGMGEVYLAVRTDDESLPTAAVKVLRHGTITQERLIRAEREGWLLKGLQHPNFPEYRDHGPLPDASPFLAMEYIHGLPIDQYCHANGLGVTGRLRLFLEICDAISFLHRKLILHRDLKPSNILVTSSGIPKILDFNIAKLLRTDQSAEETLTAARDSPLFSANYASPEQVEGTTLETASDVYALGVNLYQLLTGTLPLDLGDVKDNHGQLLHELKTQEPLAPSVLLQKSLTQNSATFDERWRKTLRGDLDTIVLKALAKDQRRRYLQVNDLATDIRHYLASRPILAQRPTFRYRTGKFINRYRIRFAFVAMFLAMLLLGSAAVVRQYAETVRERDRSETLSDFMVEIFAASNPEEAAGVIPTARTLLDAATDRIEASFKGGDPLLYVDLLSALGRSYQGLGLYDQAQHLQEEEVRLRKETRTTIELAKAQGLLGRTLQHKGEFDAAETLLEQALGLLERGDHSGTLEYADTLNAFGLVRRELGHFAEAAEIHRKALAIQRHHLPSQDRAIVNSLHNISIALRFEQKFEEALKYAKEDLELTSIGSRPNPFDLMASHHEVGVLLRKLGRLDESEIHFNEAVQIGESIYPDGHPKLAVIWNNYGLLATSRGLYEEAEQRFRRALSMARKFRDGHHPHDAYTLSNLWDALRKQKRHDEALAVLEEALAIASSSLPSDHKETLELRSKMAFQLWTAGRREEGAQMLERVAAARRKQVEDDSPIVALDIYNVAFLRETSGQYLVAEQSYREALKRDLKSYDIDHDRVALDQHRLASTLFQLGKFEECINLERKVLASLEKRLPPEHWAYDDSRNVLGACLVGAGDTERGSKLLQESVLALEKKLDTDDWRLELARSRAEVAP